MALVVFTGGARSGKSAAAQRLASERALEGARVVVAVFGPTDGVDPEMADRIARHQADRPSGFATIEAADALSWRDAVPEDSLLVVDCLGTWLGKAMLEAWDDSASGELNDAPADTLPPLVEERTEAIVTQALEWIIARPGDTIVVTNEVGDGIVPGYASGRLFRDLLGQANRRLVTQADAAYLCVAGHLLDLAALPREASWPQD